MLVESMCVYLGDFISRHMSLLLTYSNYKPYMLTKYLILGLHTPTPKVPYISGIIIPPAETILGPTFGITTIMAPINSLRPSKYYSRTSPSASAIAT